MLTATRPAPAPEARAQTHHEDPNLALLRERTDYVQPLMRDHMIAGRHYGCIPGKDKPCLHKAGAELLLDAFGFRFYSEVTQRVQDWQTAFVEYEIRVTVVDEAGVVQADGHGCCNSMESRYKNQDVANIANTLLKIARKRALVDATLAATRSSILFTQDLGERDRDRRPARASAPATGNQGGGGAGQGGNVARGPASGPDPRATNGWQPGRGTTSPDDLHTAKQGTLLWSLAKEIHEQKPEAVILHHAGKKLEYITKAEASTLIDELRAVLENQSHARAA